MAFLDIIDIIISDHHGSLKGHSTSSALASIHHTDNDHYFNNKCISIIRTYYPRHSTQSTILTLTRKLPFIPPSRRFDEKLKKNGKHIIKK